MSTHKMENSLSKDRKRTKQEKKQHSSIEGGLNDLSPEPWTLAEDTEVRSVEFENGLLTVLLGRIVPDHHKRKEWF